MFDIPPLDASSLTEYLRRVRHQGSLDPSHRTLSELHQAHLLAIPFENLDIAMGRTISLEPDRVFDKLVGARRGGYCYEHNSLLARVLATIGFKVDMLSSRVATGPRGWGPAFDHMALRVHIDRGFLADVGFGDSFRLPLPMPGSSTKGEGYEVVERDDGMVVRRMVEEPRLGRLYLLDPLSRSLGEFEAMNVFQQSSPDVWFTSTWVVKLLLSDGRVSLTPGWLTRTRLGVATRTAVTSVSHAEELLRDVFGMDQIDLPPDLQMRPAGDHPAAGTID